MRFTLTVFAFFMLASNASAHRIGFECIKELRALEASANESRKALLSLKTKAKSLSPDVFDDIGPLEEGESKEIWRVLVLERHKRIMTTLILETVRKELLPALKQNNNAVLSYLECAERYRSD